MVFFCIHYLDNLAVFIIVIHYFEVIIDDIDGVYGFEDGIKSNVFITLMVLVLH